ncbi:MAG: hypothetical protein U0223_09560 [Nitrospira sp.]|nr:hypothetical protein [Nitrospira sp.]
MKELVPLVVRLIRSEVVPPVVVERARLLAQVELTQPVLILYVEQDVSTKEDAWLAELLARQEQGKTPFQKANEWPPWPHPIGTVPLVGPGGYAVRAGCWRESSRHVRGTRETSQ